jgi:hypothetical protein
MDGSRTGVVPVNAENVSFALGQFDDEKYVAPSGAEWVEGTVPEVAEILMDAQPKMARLKQVIGHSAKMMMNLRTEPETPLSNLFVDALRERGAKEFKVPMDFAITNFGGIRVPMPEGAITVEDIESMFPFRNYLCYAAVKGENLLKLFDHDILYFGPENANDQPLTVDCKNVSIVLLGAFENLLKAKSTHKTAAGFGAQSRPKDLTYADVRISTDDLLNFTEIRPEIAGRIDRVVSMNPLQATDYYRILLRYIDDLSKRTGTNFTIDLNTLQAIAEKAINKPLGARWAIHQANHIIDKMIYENPFENNYVYTDNDERTGDPT